MESTKAQQTKQKFVVRKWMVITAAVLLIIIVGVTVMAFIPLKTLSADAFSDYLYVNVYDQSGGLILSVKNDGDGLSDAQKKYAPLLKEGLSGTTHSVLRSAAEFNFSNRLEYVTKKVETEEPVYDDEGFVKRDESGLDVTKTVKTVKRAEIEVTSEANLREVMQSPGPGRFVLEFVFSEQGGQRKTATVRDNSTEAKENKERSKKVEFDRVRIVINDSKNIIEKYAMYLYDSDVLADGEAVLTPVRIRMNTTKLYGKLCELRKEAGYGEDNGEYVAPADGEGEI